MEICKLEHIRKDYRMGEVVTPLKDLSLTVNKGDFIAVEGPSGIGKSTLLYVMGTLLQSDEGSYTFEGKDVAKFGDDEKSELRAKKIGFLFQDSTMIQALTLRENLLFTQGVGGKRIPRKWTNCCIALVWKTAQISSSISCPAVSAAAPWRQER